MAGPVALVRKAEVMREERGAVPSPVMAALLMRASMLVCG